MTITPPGDHADGVPGEIWTSPISAVLESLGVTAAGLSRAKVDARRRRHGLKELSSTDRLAVHGRAG